MNCIKKSSIYLVLTLALAGASRLPAEKMTLTDKQGRTLTADVLAIEKDTGKVKIKREDGQIFSLPLDNLITADHDKLLVLADTLAAAEAAKPLKPDAIKLELNRGNFKTTKKSEDVKLTTGDTVKDGVTITQENWGYALTISNRTPKPIDELRAEYRLFATVDNMGVAEDKLVLKNKAYKTPIEKIEALNKITLRTETIAAVKMAYNGNIVSSKTGRSESGERLYGIWLRVFRGDQLVQEIAMPDSLRTKEKW
ncbi:MAG: hypothetical protein H2172_07960 [Opitutus sp.]|nr:hypothetical protein [Opitutus sp.]MCS6245968.1 hypothetical protein [Opitutus sp.]MCS6275951.1 hypothetical protein [Opitutus sp.]MCS6301046.1 hypothetical protein [Opitutus sp.]